ncbi:[FeFe] hydrogenase H-cluster maturation GTPase HydF [bacterium]|nr:[FeFe] hydrogenase H-cluster maturation GTPase HydF [bacterium]
MEATPKGFRLHIGIFGRRNVGKSSLLNAITNQDVSLVSEIAGTTTDPVEKPMELLPLGPVLFIDTAGVDDEGALGSLRVKRTRDVLDRTDLALLVAESGAWGAFENAMLSELHQRSTPMIVVFNKADLGHPDEALLETLKKQDVPYVMCVASTRHGVLELREALIFSVPDELIKTPPILSDLVPPGEMAVLVVPIDLEAPKGRIILPQVQAIRDVLDNDSMCVVLKETRLAEGIANLKRRPRLVVTDSQAFERVNRDTPLDVPMTSFSILFSRLKGDLNEMTRGALAIGSLKPGDPVLIAESCTHHPVEDDIGRVKIPRLLARKVGGPLDITWVRGHDFPADLERYKLAIHCGACMFNRREVLSRILRCKMAGVPISNYGLVIAYTLDTLERAVAMFPETAALVRELNEERQRAEA